MSQLVFLILAGGAVVSAIGVVAVRHTVYGALFLGLCLSMVGGLYALLGADFLFTAQILIYVSAIAILFLFVILLSGRRAEIEDQAFNASVFPAVVASVLMAVVLAGTFLQARGALRTLTGFIAAPTTASIGEAILTNQAVGMEILGVVLLVSLMGATLLTKGLAEKDRQVSDSKRQAPSSKSDNDGSGASAQEKELEKV